MNYGVTQDTLDPYPHPCYPMLMPSQAHRHRRAINCTLTPHLYHEARELGRAMGWTMSEVIDEGLRLFIHRHAGKGRPPPAPSTRAGGERDGGRSHASQGE